LEEGWHDAAPLAVRPLVTAISVQPLRPTRVIVALGDSVTDGGAVDAKEGRSWTDILASRLEARAGAAAYAVVNAGIGGNRLIGQLIGPPALMRLDRDVFATPGVTDLIVLEGIIDFDAVVRGPGDSSALRPEFDTGDHLHPNHAAYRTMGEAVDLSLFDH